MEVHGGTDIHPAACGGHHTRANVCALKDAGTSWPVQEQVHERNCGPWKGAWAGAGLLAGLVTP